MGSIHLERHCPGAHAVHGKASGGQQSSSTGPCGGPGNLVSPPPGPEDQAVSPAWTFPPLPPLLGCLLLVVFLDLWVSTGHVTWSVTAFTPFIIARFPSAPPILTEGCQEHLHAGRDLQHLLSSGRWDERQLPLSEGCSVGAAISHHPARAMLGCRDPRVGLGWPLCILCLAAREAAQTPF